MSQLSYEGAFRLPASSYGDSDMNFAQGPLAYRAATNSLYIVGHAWHQAVAEFAVPGIGAGTVLANLPMATAPRQPFSRLLPRVASNPQNIDTIGGLALIDGPQGTALVANVYEYYDAAATNTHTTMVVHDAGNLAGSTVSGYFAINGAAHVSGWVSDIPPTWQTLLGGTHIAGHASGIPIIGRLSVGPSAFVFDPQALLAPGASPGPVPATALLDFSLQHRLHPDLDNAGGDNTIWTHLSRAVHGFIVPGTRTYLTLGHTGGHASGICYKCTPVGASQACGGYCARNVDDYRTAYWLWDVADMVAVREGQRQPWELRPYAHGTFPTPFPTTELGGASFDAATGRLYVSLQFADTEQGTYANPPVIAVYRVD